MTNEPEDINDNMSVESNEPAEDSHLEADYEDRNGCSYEEEPCNSGWPGDGSGEDDLADYNANEADDYANEGDCG